MTTQKEEYTCLEGRYANRRQAPSDVTFQPQQQFEQRQLLTAIMLDASRAQGVVPFATRCPISLIRPNRSSRFCD
jgi:hypothetical protein